METIKPIQIIDIQQRRRNDYVRALGDSVDLLRGELPDVPLPLQVSHLRGGIPVLSHDDAIDTRSTAVVANCGALSFNSPAFVDADHDPDLAKTIAYDAVAYGPRMLGYSLSKDRFIFESPDPIKSVTALWQITESYKHIGIEVTTDFTHVDSVNLWMKAQRGRMPILANAYDPILLSYFGRTFREKEALFQKGLSHAAAYTKNATTEHWKNSGVPVPPTYYFHLNGNSGDVAEEITEILGSQGYTHAVFSTFDGAGGDGVRFVSLDTITDGFTGRFQNARLMVQGLLPLQESPCVIANIHEDTIDPRLVSRQRFSSPGAHGGNVWESDLILSEVFPKDFESVVMSSLKALQEVGIRGQVNVDPLVISKETAERFHLPATTLMREANIRPAGSSVILRIRQGSVDGLPVTRVATTSIKIPFMYVQSETFLTFLNSQCELGTRVILYGYDIHSDKASLAFVGGEGVDAEKLDKIEKATLAMFQ